MGSTVNMQLKNCYIPSDAYYIISINNAFMCPDSSINIVNAIQKISELNDSKSLNALNEYKKIRKSDTYISQSTCKIRGNMFFPLYAFVRSEDDFNAVKDSISTLLPGIKTFDDLIKHNKKLAKKTLDKLFGDDLCYIVVNPETSDGDFLTCDSLIPSNDSVNGYTKQAIAFFENILENGFYKTT